MSDWFVKNANPLEEDLDSMRVSLLSLFRYLTKNELVKEDFLKQAENYLLSG